MIYNPDNRPGDPTIGLDYDKPVMLQCAYDGKHYDETLMLFDSLGGFWIYNKNLEAYAKRELPEHEQESYIQLIKEENGFI